MRRQGSTLNLAYLKATLSKSILTSLMFKESMKRSKVTLRFLSALVVAVALAGCATEPPPPLLLAAEPAPPPAVIETAPVVVDDIPPNTSAAVRAHLIKLRELRDQGKISGDDYQSRRALLLDR